MGAWCCGPSTSPAATQVRKGAILFKSEAIRAVVNENKAYIIKVKSHRVSTAQPWDQRPNSCCAVEAMCRRAVRAPSRPRALLLRALVAAPELREPAAAAHGDGAAGRRHPL